MSSKYCPMNLLRVLSACFLLFLSSGSFAQVSPNNNCGGRWDRNTISFEPPTPGRKVTDDYEIIKAEMEACKAEYLERVYKQVEDLHHCFRVISNYEKSSRIRAAARNQALELFKDRNGNPAENVRYRGYVLDTVNFKFVLHSNSLELYLKELANPTKFNICWGIETLNIQEGNFVASSSRVVDDTVAGIFYKPYTAAIKIKEVVSFRQKLVYETELCKEIRFQLRYVKRIDSLNPGFYWNASMYEVVEVDSKLCNSIDSMECPDGEIMVDTNFVDTAFVDTLLTPPTPCAKHAPAYSYLIPGYGFNFFRENKKKIPAWPLITGAWGFSIGSAVYYKNKMNRSYQAHLDGTILSDRDFNYRRTVTNHNRLLLYSGIAAAIWIGTDALIFFKDNKDLKKCRENFEKKSFPTTSIRPNLLPHPGGGLMPAIQFVKRY